MGCKASRDLAADPKKLGKAAAQDKIVEATVEKVWAEFDKDGNGSLDKNEMSSFITNYLAEMQKTEEVKDLPGEDQIQEAFKAFDSNADGKVTKDEMTTFFKSVIKK